MGKSEAGKIKAIEKVALILVLWVGLSATWLAGASWAQSADLEEVKRLYDQGGRLYAQGMYAETVPLIQKALELRERALGPEHPKVAESLNDLGILYQEMDDYDTAAPLFKRALIIWEKKLGPEHEMVAVRLNNLATLYASMGIYSAAEPLFKRCLRFCNFRSPQGRARGHEPHTGAS